MSFLLKPPSRGRSNEENVTFLLKASSRGRSNEENMTFLLKASSRGRSNEENVTFKPHHDPSHLYFVTATVSGWRQIFTEPTYAHIVLDSLDWHRRQVRWLLFAYVLMPNHLHAIVKPQGERTISDVLQSFGSFTAHALLARMEAQGRG
ncbi:MAG: hypothetical protein PVH17_07840, partial [Anaerolineae bacterium]